MLFASISLQYYPNTTAIIYLDGSLYHAKHVHNYSYFYKSIIYIPLQKKYILNNLKERRRRSRKKLHDKNKTEHTGNKILI